MKWLALTILFSLSLCAQGVACLSPTLAALPPNKFDWETLVAITPPVLRASPLANWPSRVWGRVATHLSETEIDGIKSYLTIFAKDPSRATLIFKSKFAHAPQKQRYVLQVEDNVISCYLLLWERGVQAGSPGLYLDFALERLKSLRNVTAPLYKNGRIVHQIGLWALQRGRRKYAQFVDVVRASKWAIVEFDPMFPRPRTKAQD